jgi:hypothetical protein
METQTKEQSRETPAKRIQRLDKIIRRYHVPRSVRPIAYTALSTLPLLFSLAVHTTWKHVSPETYSSEIAKINHTLAGVACVGYNGIRAINGEFCGLVSRCRDYFQAEDELASLKTEYENLEAELK